MIENCQSSLSVTSGTHLGCQGTICDWKLPDPYKSNSQAHFYIFSHLIGLPRSHSQLFWHISKSCVVNFAFFAWNPFNLPRVVGWYHWNPQNRPKGALFRGDKKSRIFFKKSLKILNCPWRAHFWAHRHLSYHFGNLWPCTRRWIKGYWPKVARSITYWPFFEKLFCSRNFWFPTFGILMFLIKSHYFKELLGILEKNLWNGPQSGFSENFFLNNAQIKKWPRVK